MTLSIRSLYNTPEESSKIILWTSLTVGADNLYTPVTLSLVVINCP